MKSELISQLEKMRCDAMVRADVAVLSDLMSNDLVWIHGSARVDTKDGLIAAIGSGATKYFSIDVEDDQVRNLGGLLFRTGVANMTAEVAGTTLKIRNRFTIVWMHAKDKWQIVHWQSTALPKT